MTSVNSYQRMYDRMAPFYASAVHLLPPWKRYVEEVLPWLEQLDRETAVLEIGPGPGILLSEMAARFQHVTGVDISSAMLQQAQYRLQQTGASASLVQGDATYLPFASDAFGAVVLTFAFSAIPDGLAAMMEMTRVLCPEGLLVLVDAGEPSDSNPLGMALARLWEIFDDFMRDEATLMQAAGLSIIQRREFGAFNGIRLVVGKKRQQAK